MTYDSRPDTWAHIHQVQQLMAPIIADLQHRSLVHDQSKLEAPEVEVFDEYTPKLRNSTYGSEEYKEFLVGMGEGLQHHYAHNRHHPEHHADGVHGMHLLDLIEMLADWKAATMRHANGDLARSIIQNRERFGYGDEIQGLLERTAEALGWIPHAAFRHAQHNYMQDCMENAFFGSVGGSSDPSEWVAPDYASDADEYLKGYEAAWHAHLGQGDGTAPYA